MRGVLLPILEKIPRTLYVEPYCGALGLFLGKPPERAEVVNDSNRALVNCLKTLRDRDAARELQELLSAIPLSRAIYYELTPIVQAYFRGESISEYKRAANLADYTDDFVAAVAFYYVQNTGFAGAGMCASFGGGAKGKDAARIIRGYANARDRIMSYCNRLQAVCVECLDALDCVKRYDHEDTLYFIDPPYNCATSAGYRTSWTRDDERELVDVLTTLKGSFVLTVYDNEDYRRLLDLGARRMEHTKTTTVPTVRNTMSERIETIYIKANHERRSN